MNGIIAALFILMMFVLTGIGMEYERTDSTDSTDSTYIKFSEIGTITVEEAKNPDRWLCDYYLKWLFKEYHVLDKYIWKKTDDGAIYYRRGTYIKK